MHAADLVATLELHNCIGFCYDMLQQVITHDRGAVDAGIIGVTFFIGVTL